LISAYKKAFSGNNDVVLFLKVNWISANAAAQHVKKIYDSIPGKNPKIAILDRKLSSGQINDLYHRGHIFVLPHKSEGWGLPIFISMALGKPVIATRYYGTEEFMDETNSYPITKYRLGPVKQANHFYNPSMRWAYPNEEQLIELLRKAYDDYVSQNETYKSIVANAKKVGVKYSISSVGRIFKEHINRIRNQFEGRASASRK